MFRAVKEAIVSDTVMVDTVAKRWSKPMAWPLWTTNLGDDGSGLSMSPMEGLVRMRAGGEAVHLWGLEVWGNLCIFFSILL
jgi:hypothetical protein